MITRNLRAVPLVFAPDRAHAMRTREVLQREGAGEFLVGAHAISCAESQSRAIESSISGAAGSAICPVAPRNSPRSCGCPASAP